MEHAFDSTDRWITAADTLRQEVEALPFVSGLARTGLFQTRGRSKTVYGILLRAEDGAAYARIGLSLDESHVLARGAPALVKAVRKKVLKRWKKLSGDVPLHIDLVVLDLQATAT